MRADKKLTVVFQCVGMAAQALTPQELEKIAQTEAQLRDKGFDFGGALIPKDSQRHQNRAIALREIANDGFIEELPELTDKGTGADYRENILMRQPDAASTILCLSYQAKIASILFGRTMLESMIDPMEYKDYPSAQKLLDNISLRPGAAFIVRFPQNHWRDIKTGVLELVNP